MENAEEMQVIVREFELEYKRNGLSESYDEILGFAQNIAKEAREKYQKFSKPRIATLEANMAYSVRQELTKDIGRKTVEKVSIDSKNPATAALARLMGRYPLKDLEAEAGKFWNVSAEARKKYWEENIAKYERFEEKYTDLVKARNEQAKQQGFGNFIDQYLKTNGIPRQTYDKFLKNADRLVDIYGAGGRVVDEYTTPCFICEEREFLNVKTVGEAIDIVAREFPILKRFNERVEVNFGEVVATKYLPETDSFAITIRKDVNSRHQILGLLHELCHVVRMTERLQNGEDILGLGKLRMETDELEIFLPFLKKLSEKVYRAYLRGMLEDVRMALFEIEIHLRPENPAKIYAETFNRCYRGSKQTENPFYIFKPSLIKRPLSLLMYAVAEEETVVGEDE